VDRQVGIVEVVTRVWNGLDRLFQSISRLLPQR